MTGGEGEVRLPIPSYLIEHPKGTALFDTGMHPDCQRDPAARAGRASPSCSASTTTPARTSRRGSRRSARPGEDRPRRHSHLHFDHVGGNESIPTRSSSRRLSRRRHLGILRRLAARTTTVAFGCSRCRRRGRNAVRVDDEVDLRRVAAERLEPRRDVLAGVVVEAEQLGDARPARAAGRAGSPGACRCRTAPFLGVLDEIARDRQPHLALAPGHQPAEASGHVTAGHRIQLTPIATPPAVLQGHYR